jgi:two-component system, NarL family, response regulator DevR
MNGRVLIVDDDASFRDVAATLVRRHGFDVVDVAGTVAEALEAAASCKPTAALIDVHLPDGTGLELARRLHERAPDLQVLLTSSDPEAVEADAADMPAFVGKTSLAAVDLRGFLA